MTGIRLDGCTDGWTGQKREQGGAEQFWPDGGRWGGVGCGVMGCCRVLLPGVKWRVGRVMSVGWVGDLVDMWLWVRWGGRVRLLDVGRCVGGFEFG